MQASAAGFPANPIATHLREQPSLQLLLQDLYAVRLQLRLLDLSQSQQRLDAQA